MAGKESTPRSAWLLLAFLTLLNVMNFVDRQLLLSLQVPIKRELRLSHVELTLLAGYAFVSLYATFGLFLGTVADRWNRPRLIALGLLVWSASTAASGLATNFWHLALARVCVGIGEATLTPAALAMLSDVFPPRKRAFASGVYYLGIPFGAGLSLIVSGLLGPHIGWQNCFFVLGLLGVVLVIPVWLLKDPPRGGTEATPAAATRAAPPSRSLLEILGEIVQALRQAPALGLTIAGSVLLIFSVGATWLDPAWLQHERGFSQQQTGLFLGIIFLLGGSVGNLLGGWLGDWFHRRWSGGRLLSLIVIKLAIVPLSISFRFLPPDSWLFPVACFFGSILVTISYGPVFAAVQDLAPVRIRSSIIAFLILGQNLLGSSLGAVVAATLAGVFGSLTWGIFVTGQVGLLALPLFWLAARRYRTDQERVTLISEVSEPCAKLLSSPVPARR